MKRKGKNLLPGKVYRRDARNFKLSKIKSKVPFGFNRLPISFLRVALILLLVLFFSGYHPVLAFPPVRASLVSAAVNSQIDQIITSSFPQPVILPHPGYLSTRFSTWHPGVDIASGLGMPIHPITAGVVEETNYGFWGYGNNVVVSHSNGFKSKYAHMGRIFVSKDQAVNSEIALGEVGLTGYTTGPHTHLEVTYQDKFIDPLTILPQIPDMPKVEFITQ